MAVVHALKQKKKNRRGGGEGGGGKRKRKKKHVTGANGTRSTHSANCNVNLNIYRRMCIIYLLRD